MQEVVEVVDKIQEKLDLEEQVAVEPAVEMLLELLELLIRVVAEEPVVDVIQLEMAQMVVQE
jgi:hypothetical protein